MKSSAKVLLLLVTGMLAGLPAAVQAATTNAYYDVSINLYEIASIAASGDPPTITIVAPAIAGNLPATQSDASTTLLWSSAVDSSLGRTRKLTASISALFDGINLSATVAVTTGTGDLGTSAGKVLLATIDKDFITGMGSCYTGSTGNTVTFEAVVTGMVAPYTAATRVITWTLTSAS
ncbi:MAG TPA: hypothetical protein ENH43_00170 [Phycisphaerales bacterium]|nr:hypothetical protein [Phycisphaerales bacterium]